MVTPSGGVLPWIRMRTTGGYIYLGFLPISCHCGRDRLVLAGLTMRYHPYNQVPPESSWVWNWFPDEVRWENTIAGSNQTIERLIQVLETASFHNGKNEGPFGEELKIKGIVDEKIPKQFASTKALLLSLPGAGSERVRALLEQATGSIPTFWVGDIYIYN
jgi:hypothetical protein